MNFDGFSEKFAAECRTLVIGQGLQEQVSCLPDVGKRFRNRLSV